jgi:methionine-rich copper-binding protein CopC
MRKLIASLIVVAGLASASSVWAHAHLVSADPPVGGSVAATDTLYLTFSEGIELAFSKVEIAKADGSDLGATKIAADSKDAKIVVVTLPAKLAPGDYKVHWHVVSVDTHHTEGTFAFTVTP